MLFYVGTHKKQTNKNTFGKLKNNVKTRTNQIRKVAKWETKINYFL